MAITNNKLSNFTDILSEEIPNSQPLSLSSSNNSQTIEQDNLNKVTSKPNQYLKNCGQKGDFRSIEEIDLKYRHVFSYQYFNLVQSKVIEDALYSDKSMVVCAPTGSGKTVVFEMAIVQLLMAFEDKNYNEDYKIIYMAPVKALCTERLTEWYPKFTRLGLLCIEVTGDTDVDFPQLKPYRIIITTPEKWDMLTRRWKDHRSLVEEVKLFLIDEVHILNDEARGPVLEAVVSRMRTVESSAQSSHRIEQLQRQYEGCSSSYMEVPAPRIRFVAVSATVSNPEDVAAWLGTRDRPAVFYKFGDECRPVKLRRVVEGYPCAPGASIFKFDIILNYKIWPIIQKYHNGKPTLIFCNTRKSVLLTAEALAREVTVTFTPDQRAKLTNLASAVKTKKIQSLLVCGVGCHHAGLLYEERNAIEQAFRNRELPILITTTTLAMGVNLPAHLVIIKNTQQYINGTYQEYSISTILQMVGRAGRPQFDTEATAVIMTRLADKARYQALVGGCEPLQSYLHKRLAENLNSEAALCTVCDVAQCVQWLNSTFLSVRAAREPKRYLGLPPTAPANHISKKIEELCVKAMNGLASAGLINMDEASCIQSTEAGRLMSMYYLDLETMKLIMKVEGTETLEGLLWLVCCSHELSEMHLRMDERRCLNGLNRSNTAPTIRYPMKGKINTRQMKSNCVIQALLGCLPIPDPSLNQEATKIIRIAERVCKCLVAYLTRPNFVSQRPKYYSAVLNALILAKCVVAHMWENSPYLSRQLRGIGPALSGLLASAGKVNFTLLLESHPRDLERIMNKTPPAGNMLRKQVSLLPQYRLELSPVDADTVRVQLLLVNRALLAENMSHLTAGANHKCYIIVGDSDNHILNLLTFRDVDLITVYGGCITFDIVRLHSRDHKVNVHCISSNFVGVDEKDEYLFMDVSMNTNSKQDQSSNTGNKDNQKQNNSVLGSVKNQKRKNNNDISTCKEKKKREYNLIETLQNLKKSFSKSTNDIKGEFSRTKEMSHAILQDLLESDQDTLIKEVCKSDTPVTQNDKDDLDIGHNIDEKKICSILEEIESEINIVQNVKNEPKNNKLDNNSQLTNKEETNSSVYVTGSKNIIRKNNRRNINNKNNFSFLDLVENKHKDEDSYDETEKEHGLSNTVKYQIDQYLSNNNFQTMKKDYDGKNYLNIKNENQEPIYTTEQDQVPYGENKCKMQSIVEKGIQKEQSNNMPTINLTVAPNTKIETNTFVLSKFPAAIDNSKSALETTNFQYAHNKLDLLNSNDAYVINEMVEEPNLTSKESYLLSTSNSILTQSQIVNMEDDNCIQRVLNAEVLKGPILETNDNNLISHNKGQDGDIDYVNKYSFSTSKLNIVTRNDSNRRIQVVNKLKIDLEVTEIVYNETNTNTDETKKTCDKQFENDNDNISKEKAIILSQDTILEEMATKNHENNVSKKNNIEKCTLDNDTSNPEMPQNINSNTIESIIQKYKIMTSERNDVNDRPKKPVNKTNEIAPITKPKRLYRIADLNNDATAANTKHMLDRNKTLDITTENAYARSDLNNPEIKSIYTIPKQTCNDYKCVSPPETYKSVNSNSPTKLMDYKCVSPQGNNCTMSKTIDDNGEILRTSALENDSGPSVIVSETEEDIVTQLTDSESGEINQSMFNPKNLLQCLSGDHIENELIPPPIDFGDDDPYSPIQHNEPNRIYFDDIDIDTDTTVHFSQNVDVEQLEYSQGSNPIETWTLSEENIDDASSINMYPRENELFFFRNQQHSNFKNVNLNDFKFKGKPKLRK